MKKTKFKILSFILVMSFVLPLCPTLGVTAQEKTDVVVLSEAIDLRKSNEKHYYCSDGSMIAVQYDEDVHYLDSLGKWQDIDNTLVYDSTSKSYKNAKNPSFNAEFNENQTISLSNKNNTINWKTKVVSMDSVISENSNVQLTQTTLSGNNNPLGKKVSNKETFALNKVTANLKYQNNGGDITTSYTVAQNSIKEDVILTKNIGYVNFATEYNLSQPCTVIVNDDGSLDFINSSNEVMYQVGKPYLYDGAGSVCESVNVNVMTKGTKVVVTYSPNRSWFTSAEREYPVTFDPVVSILNGYNTNIYTNGYSYGGSNVIDKGQSLSVGYVYTPGGSLPDEQHVYFKTVFKPLAYPAINLDENNITSISVSFNVSSVTGSGNFEYYEISSHDNIMASNVAFVPYNPSLGEVSFSSTTTSVTMELPTEDYYNYYYGNTRYGFVAMVDEATMQGSGTSARVALYGTSNYSKLPTITVSYKPKNIENRYVFIENSSKYLSINDAGTGVMLKSESTRTINGQNVVDPSYPTATGNPLKSIWLVKSHSSGALMIVSAYDTTKVLAYNNAGTLSLINYSSVTSSSSCFWHINYGDTTTIVCTVSGNQYLLYNNGTNALVDVGLNATGTSTSWRVSDAFAIKGDIADNREYILYNPAIEKALQFSNVNVGNVSFGDFDATVEEMNGSISYNTIIEYTDVSQCIKLIQSESGEYYIQPYINGSYGTYYLGLTSNGTLTVSTTETLWTLEKQSNGKYCISSNGKYLGCNSSKVPIVASENIFHIQWYIDCVSLSVEKCFQEANNTCGASSSAMILRYLGYLVSEEDYLDCIEGHGHYDDELPSGKYPYNAYTLNRFINGDCKKYTGVYDYITNELTRNSSIEKYVSITSSSLSWGYPVNCLVKVSDNSNNYNVVNSHGLYMNVGHYIVTTGVYYSYANADYECRIIDVDYRFVDSNNNPIGFKNTITVENLWEYSLKNTTYWGYTAINLIAYTDSLY